MNDFGPLLKLLRNNAGYTQHSFAQLLHTSDSSVSKWERGTSLPDAATLRRISHILNISCDELLHPTLTLSNKSISPTVNKPETNNENTTINTIEITTIEDNNHINTSTTFQWLSLKTNRILHIFISVFVFIIIFAIITYKRYSLHNTDSFTFVEARNNVESEYGTSCELVYFINSEESTNAIVQFANSLADDWFAGKYEDCHEQVLSVSFYHPTDDITNWEQAYIRSFYYK